MKRGFVLCGLCLAPAYLGDSEPINYVVGALGVTHDISSEQFAYLSDLFSRAVNYQSQEQFNIAR